MIIWLMMSPKNFEKVVILKIQQLFSSEVSKFTSVRNQPNSSLKYWFIEARLVFCVCYCPKNDQNVIRIQNRLHLVRTITITGKILVKIYFCHPWKCIISRVVCRSDFWHLRRKLAVIFSKCLFFQNSLVISWAI